MYIRDLMMIFYFVFLFFIFDAILYGIVYFFFYSLASNVGGYYTSPKLYKKIGRSIVGTCIVILFLISVLGLLFLFMLNYSADELQNGDRNSYILKIIFITIFITICLAIIKCVPKGIKNGIEWMETKAESLATGKVVKRKGLCPWCFKQVRAILQEENFFSKDVCSCPECGNIVLKCCTCENYIKGGLDFVNKYCQNCSSKYLEN